MSTSSPAPARDMPALLPLMPLMYVAWADGILTPSEMQQIHRSLDALPWIEAADKEQVTHWLDPLHPPSATVYQGWLRAIRQAAIDIPEASRHSLAELGMQMAQLTGNPAAYDTPEARRALEEVEAALGIVGAEASREMLAQRPAPSTDIPVTLDVEAMQALLDGIHIELRNKIRTLLRDPVFAYVSVPKDAYREQVLRWCQLLAEQGLGALAFPVEQGGEGDMHQFITAFEMLAYHDLSMVIKYGVQFGLFGGSIQRLGTEKHHRNYLSDVGSLTLPGCFAMTELGHGSNVREIETQARFDSRKDGFVIQTPHDGARKEYIGNAACHGQLATVFAQLVIDEQNYGVHAFLVPLRDTQGHALPGIRLADCGEKLGLNGVDNGRIWFDGVFIPRENLLDRFAQVDADGTYSSPILSEGRRFFTMLGTLVGGRVSIGKGALSAAKSGLTIAIRYGNRRRQFGPKGEAEVRILDYRTHQRRLLPRLATAYALHFALEDLSHQFSAQITSGEQNDEVEVRASGLKAYSSWFAMDALQTCREACGGQGYLAENRFAALKADIDIFTTFEGDNTVLMLQVAKGLLTRFKQSFSDMKFFGLLKYLAQEATTTLSELNPVVTRTTDEAHLRDPAFHHAAFVYREHDLLQAVARRLKKRIEQGMDSYDAFIACQDHLVTLAQAHTERIVLEAFQQACSKAEGPLQRTLEKLCTLYALSQIEKDRGWFLEQGYIEGNKAKAIRKQVNMLCTEVRPFAEDLVDAFGIPDACLSAPIGQKGA